MAFPSLPSSPLVHVVASPYMPRGIFNTDTGQWEALSSIDEHGVISSHQDNIGEIIMDLEGNRN